MHSSTSLRIERAIRTAARSGNRMLAGGVARVEVDDPATRAALIAALRAMGVRLEERAGIPAEFVFADTAEPTAPPVSAGSASGVTGPPAPDAGPLPAVVVGIDGTVRSPRADDAAGRIAWAARGMRTTAVLANRLRERLAAGGGTGGAPRLAVSLVLEPKTAALALTLADAGFEVAVFGAVSETDPEVAAALAADGRVRVFAPRSEADRGVPASAAAAASAAARVETAAPAGAAQGADRAAVDAEHAAAILEWGPDYLIDDGSHLVRLAHTEHPEALDRLRAAAEETTSGVRPLREMEAEGALRIPVISVNDARTKTDFDNLIGTGQSCVLAIADVLDEAGGYTGLSGTEWCVIGYGPVGVGVARFAAALGARITVVEHDAVRALSALHDGHEARSAEAALPLADVVVSATGVWHTVDARHFALMRPGTAVAVAGGIDDELALDELASAGWRCVPVTEPEPEPGPESEPGPGGRAARLHEWIAPNRDRGPLVLSHGEGVNYTAGEGNPVEVMDLSFATQLSALDQLLQTDPEPGVAPLAPTAEAAVARVALEMRGGSTPRPPRDARAGGAAQPWRVHRYRRAL